MRPAQKARKQLEGSWMISIAVQTVVLAAWMLVLFMELAVLRLSGLGVETVVSATSLWNGQWMYGVMTIGFLLMDWLILSPLYLGQRYYFWMLAKGLEASFSLIFVFYGHRYSRSLHWRFSLFLRRLMWSALCFLPAALITGYAQLVRQSGAGTPLADITMMFCTLFGFILLFAGMLVSELVMLRYFPASYLILNHPDEPVGKLFHESRLIMKGNIGDLFWVYIGFIGWFLSCLLLIPYFYVAPLFNTTKALTAHRYMQQKKE